LWRTQVLGRLVRRKLVSSLMFVCPLQVILSLALSVAFLFLSSIDRSF
jgi:hypothetical protein